MILTHSKTYQSSPDRTSEPSSPYKQNSPSIDFSELLIRANNSTISTLSTNDNCSVHTDEDATKSLLSLESFDIKLPKKISKKKIETLPSTLKEIVTKRPYVKSNKYSKKNRVDNTSESLNKKRQLDIQNSESFEIITKKEKLENGKTSGLDMNPKDNLMLTKIVFKDGKAQIETQEVKQEENANNSALEVVNSKAKVTTSSSFKKGTHTKKWTDKETKKFYRALELFGTDFSMIARLFPERNRNQMKHKFLREEKQAPEKIEAIFRKYKAVTFTSLIARYQKRVSSNSFNTINQNVINIPSRKNSSANMIEGQSNIVENTVVRNGRSESFHSVLSFASVDMEIMEELADAFVAPTHMNNNNNMLQV